MERIYIERNQDLDGMIEQFYIVDGDIPSSFKKQAEQKFRELADLYNLEPDDYGKSIMFSGKPYKIIGIRTRAPKRCVQIQRYDGKIFVTSSEEVNRKLGRKNKSSYESFTLTSKDIGTLNLSDLEGD